MKVLVAALAVSLAAVAAACANGATHGASPAFCTGKQLKGTFAAIPGSPAAGSISYRLKLENVSSQTCRLTGLPKGVLLSKTDKALPTHITAAFKGALTAVLVTLDPGRSAHADARFSPDVPGVGEGHPGAPCEPVAYWLRVTPNGGGATKAKISPPTSVCEHGSLRFTAYGS
jgi:hypothetical protein